MTEQLFKRASFIEMMWHAYKWTERTPPEDWTPMEETYQDHLDGFSALTYRSNVNSSVLTVSICGAEGGESQDLASCQSIFDSQMPAQYVAADQYLKDLVAFNQECKILIVGHSLGGALAKLLYLTDTQNLPSIQKNDTPFLIKFRRIKNTSNKCQIL